MRYPIKCQNDFDFTLAEQPKTSSLLYWLDCFRSTSKRGRSLMTLKRSSNGKRGKKLTTQQTLSRITLSRRYRELSERHASSNPKVISTWNFNSDTLTFPLRKTIKISDNKRDLISLALPIIIITPPEKTENAPFWNKLSIPSALCILAEGGRKKITKFTSLRILWHHRQKSRLTKGIQHFLLSSSLAIFPLNLHDSIMGARKSSPRCEANERAKRRWR